MKPYTTIAIRAARKAGHILLKHVDHLERLIIESKGLNDYVSEVDKQAEKVIIETLLDAYPEHSILGEESGIHKGKNKEFEWVIDPLDGTTNYLHGIPQFAISIALKRRGILEMGIVYDPMREEMFQAYKGEGAYLNDRRIRVSNRISLSGAILGTGLPYRNERYIDDYLKMLKTLMLKTAGIRRPGSAALDFAYVAAGRFDGFWELGLSQWDFAAGALLVKEAGGTVTDITGGSRYLETGHVIAGNIKIQREILNEISPFLDAI